MPASTPQPQDPSACWKPALHQHYFLILGDGRIQMLRWADTPFDHGAWQFGNCFKTHRDAVRAREVLRQVLPLQLQHGDVDLAPRIDARPRARPGTAAPRRGPSA